MTFRIFCILGGVAFLESSWGFFAKRLIRKRMYLGDYLGVIHRTKISSRFLVFVEQEPSEDSFYIDGKNWSRHLNSPGKRGIPNARLEMQDRTPEVWSIGEIQEDQEIYIDYGFCKDNWISPPSNRLLIFVHIRKPTPIFFRR